MGADEYRVRADLRRRFEQMVREMRQQITDELTGEPAGEPGSPGARHEDEAELTTEELMEGADDARIARKLPHAMKDIPLPDPDDPRKWLPLASAPAMWYWFWRWGTTKDRLRAAIKTHSQWAVDYKFGIPDITSERAMRWAFGRQIIKKTEGRVTYEKLITTARDKYGDPPWGIELDELVRRHAVALMHSMLFPEADQGLEDWPEEWVEFGHAMRFVQEHVQKMKYRTTTAFQFEEWFQAAAQQAARKYASGVRQRSA